MKQLPVAVTLDEDVHATIGRLAEASRRSFDDEVRYILGQAAVGEPVDPRPGVRKIGMVEYIRNRVEALGE
ncbi:hypothetical protein SB754_11845 [Leifsonia sp. SIMBA_070]